ncbi:HEAT repeat domain-containing protein, partial [bacterium]|nr:HEAT repeat domain-containing protein [bacterium]
HLEEILNHNNVNYENLFEDLQNSFKARDIVNCYKYILENKQDVKLLNYTIRHINKTRYFDILEPLIEFIKKEYNDVAFLDLKVLAIKTMSNFKNTKCVPVLLHCLNDKNSNYKIRLASAEALGKIGDKNAFESLSNVVNDEAENSAYIKESAVVALGLLGDKRALDVFEGILNTKEMFLGKFSYLKERIVEAMAKFDISKDNKALKILKRSLLDTSSRLRISAIETLSNSDFDCAYELIYDRLLYDDDTEVKKNALIALYNISDRKILDEVIKGEFEFELKRTAKEIIDEYEQ